MSRGKYLIFLLLLLSVSNTIAETFVVTSNADSGAGTLREALSKAAANGDAETDYIHFNLPVSSEANTINDRTIRLRSQLPVVTSKIVIDGSTQPSPVFGVSGAKVIIEREFANVNYPGLVISSNVYDTQTTDVEIYGLYIRNFANITSLSNVNTSQGSGIVVEYKVNNITIGKPGKGNVISGNLYGIVIRNSSYYTNNTLGNITIQSNFIGVMDNGSSANTNVTGILADLYENSITIGGDNQGEGNVIAANGTDISLNRTYYSSNLRSAINIINNKIGTDQSGTQHYKDLPIFSQTSTVEMYGIRVNAQLSDLRVVRNIISGHRNWGLTIQNADFEVLGNIVGTDVTKTKDLGNSGGIRIETGARGAVGGSAPDDANYIGYNRFGIETVSSYPIQITRNSIFCNSEFGIGKTTTAPQAFIQLLKKRSDYIAGKSTSNAEIELFYSDDCSGTCQGKTYITTVRANSSGYWEYTGNLNGRHVVGTAGTASQVTSTFSTAALREGDWITEPYTCKGPGSITITEQREGIQFQWFRLETNGAIVSIPGNQEIKDLQVGTYEVRISDGCRTELHSFQVTDQILTKPTINAPTPGCGQTNFQFSATTLRGKGTIRYTWLDANNNVRGSGTNIMLPEGTYRVRVTDDAGCEQTSDAVTIQRRPAPKIDRSRMEVTAAACGQPNGSIKGLTVSDTKGSVTYKWYTYNTTTLKPITLVGQNLDLENVQGGYYMLEITDEGDCSPVYEYNFYIGIYNSVEFGGGTIKETTCGNNNGAISGITIKEADTYKLFGPSGSLIEDGIYSGIPLEFKNMAAGTYRLEASHSVSLCSNSWSFMIPRAYVPVYSFSQSTPNATCGLPNGSITLTFNRTSDRPYRYEWRDGSGNVLTGTETELKDLGGGEYLYVAYDINGCEQTFPFTIAVTPVLVINESNAVKTNDYCGLKRGSVRGLEVSGGVPAYKYTWLDEDGKQAGSGLDLLNIGEGTYHLVLNDNTPCGEAISIGRYTVLDESRPMDDPVAADIRVCYTTEIMIPVTNKEEGNYQLYQDPSDASPLMESDKGIFIFTAAKSADYYLVRRLGHCSSNFAKIHVEVTNDNLEIANTMTPNGDGRNDTWSVKGLPDYPNITIQLYSRDGQLVYESIGQYNKPFDGYFRGAQLPAGVYYYKIDLRADCKPLSGSLTLLR